MNKEIIKAMNKKPTKWDAICKWWSKNGYKVMRILLFPLWITMLGYEEINKRINARTVWSEKRAAEILSYYIPRCAYWAAEEKAFYFYDNGMGWSMKYVMRKYIKLRDRRFWKLYAGAGGYKMREYLVENFELEGFNKKVRNTYNYSETDIIFTLKEEK